MHACHIDGHEHRTPDGQTHSKWTIRSIQFLFHLQRGRLKITHGVSIYTEITKWRLFVSDRMIKEATIGCGLCVNKRKPQLDRNIGLNALSAKKFLVSSLNLCRPHEMNFLSINIFESSPLTPNLKFYMFPMVQTYPHSLFFINPSLICFLCTVTEYTQLEAIFKYKSQFLSSIKYPTYFIHSKSFFAPEFC